MKRGNFKDALVGVLVVILAALACSLLFGGCASSPEPSRPPADTADVAETALCPPLPVCEVAQGTNAKQLAEALWSCVLEYRALYSMCRHGVAQPLPAVPAEVF